MLNNLYYVGVHCKNKRQFCNNVSCTCFIAIEVSVKPASSSQVTTKRLTLNLTGTIPAIDSVEDMSSAGQKNVNEYLNR